MKLAAHVDTDFPEGAIPVVDAFIQGQSDEEVVFLAHLFEPGALDNASGSAAVIHIMRQIAALVEAGKLARPKRSIRALLSFELFGFLRYIRQSHIAQRWKAVTCIDGAGPCHRTTRARGRIILSTPAFATWLDAIAHYAWRRYRKSSGRATDWKLMNRGYYLDDCFANRITGLAGVSFAAKTSKESLGWFRGYHSSADGLDFIDADALRDFATVAGATAMLAAAVSPTDAPMLVALCERLARREVKTSLAGFKKLVLDQKHPFGLDTEISQLAAITQSRMDTITRLCGVTKIEDPLSGRLGGILQQAADSLRNELGPQVDHPGAASDAARIDGALRNEAQQLIPVRMSADIPSFETMARRGNIRKRLGRDNEYTPMLDAADGRRCVLDLWATELRHGNIRALDKTIDVFRLYEEFSFVRLDRR